MTDSKPINPYAAPATESETVSAETILHSVLRSVPALHYSSVVTQADLRDAISKTPMRQDGQKTNSFLLLPPFLFFALLMILSNDSNAAWIAAAFAALGCLFIGVRELAARRHVSQASGNLGKIDGSLSPAGMIIHKRLQTLYYPLTSIVAVVRNSRRAVFVFDQSLTHFETVKFTDFDNPNLAEATVADLQKVLPPSPPVMLDDRRQAEPMSYDHFTPNEDAIFFEGEVHADDLRGSSYERKLRQSLISMWVRLTAVVMLVGMVVYTLAGLSLPLWLYILFVTTFYLFMFLRLRTFKRAMLGKSELLWRSRGWLEPTALVHVSAISQSRNAWALFEQPEFREQSVVFKYRPAPMWMVISRKQFANDEAWQLAKQRIEQSIVQDPSRLYLT